MSGWLYLDGEFVEKENAKVSVYDHGFLYGDGVFEGIRMYSGNIFRLREHLERLYDSAKSIMLDIPHTLEELESIVVETLKRNQLHESAYIRLVVSRGKGDLGLDPFKCPEPSIVVIAEQLTMFPKELYETGIEMVTVPTRRNRPDILSPQVKSLNYLNNILLKLEAYQAGANEALTLNTEGYVAEGSGENIFLIKNGEMFTPPTYIGALEGVTRNAIIEIAEDQGYVVREQPFTRHDVYVADEVFLTGTAAEVVPVVKVDGRVISDGVPGEKTHELLHAFRSIVVKDGVNITNHDHIQVG
ncbi:branched-chain-amino-acid transaminase [Texcoconibacillus texcoconensis]|uniref:Branched-chain-amino-acid aminotransferase n=1 Tax=Texcoconibacillus texcoconensis TaxID=1095777 RepID=A0A840QQR6_9BACI|nr:branched-chain-amino-acid transaminase [Texcoconibacillus texcoconensis]MBB5173689.1 branched-chain amino acid aminotransferase [Texcoconibacillus texcoconensis]